MCHSVARQTWTVVQPVAQFTKLWLNCLGSDPCLCNSEVSPGVDTTLRDCPFDIPPVIFPTLSGSLELPSEASNQKVGVLVSLICWAFPTVFGPSLKRIKKKAGDLPRTRGATTCLVRILSACRATLAVVAVTTTTVVRLGLEVGEREERKRGFPTPTLRSPFLLLRPAIEGSMRSSFSSQLMSISRFWLP